MPRQWNDDVHTLAAAGFQPAFQPQFVEYRQYQLRRLEHAFPRQVGIRVQIQREAIWSVDVTAAGAPGMEFDGAHLYRTDQRPDVVHFHVAAVLGIQRWVEMPNIGNGQPLGMLLEECLAAHALGCTQQGYRPPSQMGHSPVRNALVKGRQFTLGGATALVDLPLRVADPDPGDIAGNLFAPHDLFHLLRRQRLLPNDLLGGLVGAQRDENRLPDHTGSRPLGKLHLAYQLRLDPGGAAGIGHGAVDRLALLLQFLQLLMNGADPRLVETGADPARIDQLVFICIMYAKQQGTESAATALGRGKADDHEFLALFTLEFDPVGAAAGNVRAAGPLADNAFQGHGAGALENGPIVRIEDIGEPQQLSRMRG